MARKAGNAAPTAKFSYSDSDKLMSRLDVGQLRNLLEHTFPENKIIQVGPSVIKTNCLAGAVTGHIDKTPSMYLDVQRGTVRCKACQYFTRNVLQLFQDARGWSYRETISQVLTYTGQRLISDKLEAEVEAYDIHNLAVELIRSACVTYLQRLLAPPVDAEDRKNYDPIALHAARPVTDWLFEHRGHKSECVGQLPYGVWPPAHVMTAYTAQRLEDLANAQYSRFQNTSLTPERRAKVLDRVKGLVSGVSLEWVNAVAFFNGHGFRTPGLIRLRRAVHDDQKDGNYLTLPGFSEKEPIGFFGLWAPHLNSLEPSDARALRVYVVEGENDAISMQERWLSNGVTGCLAIASNGSNNTLDALQAAGVEAAYVISDHPLRGRGEVWLRGMLSTASELPTLVFRGWRELDTVPGMAKDPDEVLAHGGYDVFQRVVVSEVDKWFAPVDVWALDRTLEEATLLGPDDVREKTALAVSFGECVRNAAQLSQFVDRVCQRLTLTPAIVRGLIVRSKDDEAGFVARVVDVLNRSFHPLFKEETPRGAIIHLHHRETDRTIRFGTDDGAGALSSIANVVGDVYTFFAENVGIPAWLLPQQGPGSIMPIRELQRILSDYVKIAVQSLFHNVPSRDECEQYGQGPHAVEDPLAPFGTILYVVNGPTVYEGTFSVDGAPRMEWKKLDGPSKGTRLFLLEPVPVFPELRSVADLEAGNHFTLDDVANYISRLTQLYRTGWRTLTTDIDATLLAFYQAAFSCPVLCPSKVHVELVGQHSSGKSTLLSTFCGIQFPHLQVCAWAKGMSSYTAASLYQGFNRCSTTMGLEEFTRDLTANTAKNSQIQSCNEIMRQCTFPGGAVVTRAIPTGGVKRMVIATNIITASINPAHDPQDASRRMTIETVKVEGLKDPSIQFSETFPPEELTRMRRVFGLGLLKYYRIFREHFQEIERLLATGKVVTSFAVDTRFLRNFYPIAPLMKMLNQDWQDFVTKATESRRGRLTANARNNISTQLFDTLLRTNNMRIGSTGSVTSATVLLASSDPTKWMALNHAQSGMYYFDDLGLMVIDWISVVSPGGLLYRVEPYCRTQYNLLKHQLDQHPLALREHQYSTQTVLNALRSLGGFMRPDEITVLNVKRQVSELREVYVDRPSENREPEPSEPPDGGPPGLQRRRPAFNN